MKYLKSIVGAVFALTLAFFFNFTSVFAATTSPNINTAGAGWIFSSVKTLESNHFVEQSHSPVFHNTQSQAVPYIWNGSETVSKGYSADATLGGGWGPINAAVGFTANTSVSYTYTYESTLQIPAYEYGWYRFGYAQDEWYGHYYYQDEVGNITNSKWIHCWSPRYTEVANATSSTPPSNP